MRSVGGGDCAGLGGLGGFPVGDGLHGEVVDEGAEFAVGFGAEHAAGAEHFVAVEEHFDERPVFRQIAVNEPFDRCPFGHVSADFSAACACGIAVDPFRSHRIP